jgi:tripartite-type tricarboxylate transporter receptor subunit TctC
MKRLNKLISVFAAATAIFAAPARAAGYPEKPVTLVIPFAPGGFVHLVGLLLSENMSTSLGQPLVIMNQPGANGIVAASSVARAAPDGYTLLLTTASILGVTPHLTKSVPFDSRSDFTAIGQIAQTSNIFVVNPKSGIKTFKDLAEKARQKDSAVSYGSTGNGSLQHIAGEVLQREVKTKVLHVPYRGTAPAMVDLVGGNLSFMLGDASALPYVKAGTLSAIAVSPKAIPALPGVPGLAEAIAEAGLPNYAIPTLWYGIVGPKGVPADVVAKVNSALAETLAKPAVREKLIAGGAMPAENSSSAFLANTIRTDYQRFGDMLKTINVTID